MDQLKHQDQNPLVQRYASPEMSSLFSDTYRVVLWRKLWLALAKGEKQLGLDIHPDQIAEMEAHLSDISWETAERYEKKLRHEIMAHVYTYGECCPKAMPILHLGATSCDILDNAELITYRDALLIIQKKLVNVIDQLAQFANQYRSLPTLGLTHLQPAQITTVGKRVTLYLQDLLFDFNDLQQLISSISLHGLRGATGTQASYLSLFDGDHAKVEALEQYVIKEMGFNQVYPVSGQTYPRKLDYSILSLLSKIAQSASKFGNDLRILQSRKEIEEPFESTQIGSSAMAYKRNPMRSERLCSLARYVESLPINAAMTASVQWFERTLDDSANKRIVLSQAFLAMDGILNLYLNISNGLVVYPKMIEKNLLEELPFLITEELMMQMVKLGGNRQEIHERLRVLSMQAGVMIKQEGKPNPLLSLIRNDPLFAPYAIYLNDWMDPKRYIGRAEEQVLFFLDTSINPILKQYQGALGMQSSISL